MIRWLAPGFVAAVCLAAATGCGRKPPADTGGDAGKAEADRLVVELFTENQALKQRVEELAGEVEVLQRQLAETMVQLDTARLAVGRSASPDDGISPSDVAAGDLARVRVLDVNRDMKVVVVGGGSQAGMKPGMRFHVLRGDTLVGLIRLIDVRDAVAGGLIERLEKGGFPEAGDRLILSSKQDG